MAAKVRVSIFVVPVLLILFLLATLNRSSHCQGISNSISDRVVSAGDSVWRLLSSQRNIQFPNCSEMVSRMQCSQNPKCRWCKSFVLDDMCFGKLEAWRLPHQVFSCG